MRRPQVQLEHLSGPEDGKIVGFSKETVTIGRDSGQDVVIGHDPAVSRRHARIVREGDQLFLEDMGSSHGTFMEGRTIEGRIGLAAGASFRVGNSWLRVPE